MTPRRRFDVDELDLFNEPPHFKNRDDGSSERSSFATYLGNEVFTAYRGALGENAGYYGFIASRELVARRHAARAAGTTIGNRDGRGSGIVTLRSNLN